MKKPLGIEPDEEFDLFATEVRPRDFEREAVEKQREEFRKRFGSVIMYDFAVYMQERMTDLILHGSSAVYIEQPIYFGWDLSTEYGQATPIPSRDFYIHKEPNYSEPPPAAKPGVQRTYLSMNRASRRPPRR